MTKQKQRKRTRAREIALQLLYVADANRGISDDEVEFHLLGENAAPEVASFVRQLVTGTLSAKDEIDRIIAETAVNWRLSRMSFIDRTILRMAAYEILHIDDIPPKVSINEAVDLAKKFSTADSGAFVNGILDKILSDYAPDKAKRASNAAKEKKK